jgi:SAM-dependent methyltransferase
MSVWTERTGDACISLFGAVWDTGSLVFPQHARVLEIGCAEGDWQTPMLAARPDLQIIGIDWRDCERPGAVIRGDVLSIDFPDASFDAVVGVSSIEHIGLGHYDNDPLDPDGDRHCMERVVRWLIPGGVFYADVPYGPAYALEGTSHRVYDDAALQSRLLVPGLCERRRWYTTWAGQDHVLHEAPTPSPGMTYVALVATKEIA